MVCRGTAGFAHVSCLAEQAKILREEAEENNLGNKVLDERWQRWEKCGLCEQDYHGAVRCALGWACWKTYVRRPEREVARILALNILGNGLFYAGRHEEALPVQDAELSMHRRIGAPEEAMLAVQGNLAVTYATLGRFEEALSINRDIYVRGSELFGKYHESTLLSAGNLASSLVDTLQQFDEAKAFLLDRIPESIRALGKDHANTLRLQRMYAQCLYQNDGTSREDVTAAIAALEDIDRLMTRVYGASHPQTGSTRAHLAAAREKLARA